MDFDARALMQVAHNAGVPEDEVIGVLTEALQGAYDATPGATPGVRVVLDPDAGKITLTDPDGHPVDPPGFGARATTAARQAIVSWLRNLERVRKVGKWAHLEGTPIRATVKAITRDGDTRLDADGTMAILPAGEAIPSESLTAGQQITVLLLNANITDRETVRLTVSRRQPALVSALFEQHLGTGPTRIVGVAREPGLRSKVACSGPGDPRMELIGPAGMIARAVTAELGQEKIDIVAVDDDLAQFAAAALTPASVQRAEVIDPVRRVVRAYVTPDQISIAEGTGGVNVRLANRLTGARIEIAPTT